MYFFLIEKEAFNFAITKLLYIAIAIYMGSWRINVSYGVTAKVKKKKTSNIEDKPLMLFVTLKPRSHQER